MTIMSEGLPTILKLDFRWGGGGGGGLVKLSSHSHLW